MRIPFLDIFCNRKYLFDASVNVRKYSWDVLDCEKLFSDIMGIKPNKSLQLSVAMVSKQDLSDANQAALGANATVFNVHDG